jgi:flagellar biosynthetic protein FliR
VTLELSPATVSAFLLALARCGAWVALCPPFNQRAIPRRVRAGIAVALTLAVGPRLESVAPPLEAGPLLVSVLSQVFVGFVLGTVVNVLLQAVRVAGSLIDITGGFAIAQVYDPNTASTVSIFSRAYEVVALTLLLVSDGHLVLVRGLIASFEAAPLSVEGFDKLPGLLQADLRLLLLAALQIALPVMAAMFVTDLALGLLSKAAPTLNVMLLGLPLKILLSLLIVGMSISLLPGELDSLVDAAIASMSRFLGR